MKYYLFKTLIFISLVLTSLQDEMNQSGIVEPKKNPFIDAPEDYYEEKSVFIQSPRQAFQRPANTAGKYFFKT